MKTLVGVRFRETGRGSYFDPGDLVLETGDKVIVDVGEGEEFATVSVPNTSLCCDKFDEDAKPIKRKATEEDLERIASNKEDEKEAYKICLEKIALRELPMKLIKAEYTFERNRLIFYFTADGRVDFRELVKDLAGIFHTRIELRQIGVRDETKLLGGLGICGRPFCCKTFLTEFAPVSIKMAKEQRLSLNPNKISGVCGRLMCCLKNEEETYEYLNKRLPGKGDIVTTKEGREGVVYSVNVLKQLVTVIFEENDEKEMEEFSVDDLKRHFKRRNHNENQGDSPADFDE